MLSKLWVGFFCISLLCGTLTGRLDAVSSAAAEGATAAVELILKIAGLALTGVLLASLMKSVHKEFSIYIILATVIVVFLMILDKLTEVFVFLQSIYDSVPYGKTFFPVIFKVLAVAYIADLTAQLCRDAGESAVGGKVELAGKVIIFYLALPILSAILELIGTLLQ